MALAGALWLAVQDDLIMNGLSSASPSNIPLNNKQLDKQTTSNEPNPAPETSTVLDGLDDHFLSVYLHLSRPCLRFIIDFIQIRVKQTRTASIQNRSLSEASVLAGLAFYAQGSLQNKVSDLLGIDEKATGEAVTVITKLLSEVAPEFITFPNGYNDRMGASQVFKNISGIPHVVGVLGHLHVKVKPPFGQTRMYENTLGYRSVVMQVVYDADGNVFSLEQCCPGGTPEHELWENSEIGRQFCSFQHGHSWVVGSSALVGCGHVLTPVEIYRIKTNGALRFNQAHAKLHSLSQQVFGSLKSRFQCLRRFGSIQSPESVEVIVKACCVLHNISKKFSVPLPQDFYLEPIHPPSDVVNTMTENKADYMKDTKNEMIEMFFNTAEDKEYLKAIGCFK
ncbi:hypothetical protein DNTS_022228 [Danionella cerebrum]|uniref:DDE Tnp4 domain-containing protein n=1 Tax=Danionella cerebrum TaxID=2873325 RepID=A0A553PMX1_9TELE|nr:hypothetical protein DNTS_022228 [Danionella translucida]